MQAAESSGPTPAPWPTPQGSEHGSPETVFSENGQNFQER